MCTRGGRTRSSLCCVLCFLRIKNSPFKKKRLERFKVCISINVAKICLAQRAKSALVIAIPCVSVAVGRGLETKRLSQIVEHAHFLDYIFEPRFEWHASPSHRAFHQIRHGTVRFVATEIFRDFSKTSKTFLPCFDWTT